MAHVERGTEHDEAVPSPGSAPEAAQRHFSPKLLIRGLAWDIGLPLVAYYGLHAVGATDWVALLAASSAAALRMVWGIVLDRRLNLFALVMLLVFGVGLALALIGGDPRFLLLKDSITTAVVGLAFVGTTLFDRPLTLAAMQRFSPERAELLAQRYRDDPHVRHGYRLTSWVWGAGLLLEAALRVPLIFLLPIDVMVAVSQAMMIVAFALLIVWTSWYSRSAALSR